MSDEVEREVKKSQIEKLHLMGFKNPQIAQALNISIKTVERYKKEIYEEIKQKYKDKYDINDILRQYDKLVEEGWKNLEKLDEYHKGFAIRILKEVIKDRKENLASLGFIQVKPDQIELKSDNKISIPELIILARKMENG